MVRNLIRESLPRRAPVVWPEAAPPPPEPEVQVLLPETQIEIAAGKRTAARWAGLGSKERLQQEIEAGKRAIEKYQALREQPGSNPAAE
jgi:hypothetical protein